MKNKLRKILNNLLIGGSMLVASAIPQIVNGQVFPSPPAVINPFLSSDTTEVAKAYSSINGLKLEDISARNDMARLRVQNDRTHTIPANDDPIWACSQWTQLEIINSYNWGDGIYDNGGKLVYNGYKGWEFEQIYINGGTFVDQGKLGMPLFMVNFIIDTVTREAHAQTSLLTGNNALVGADWNDIEPRDGVTQVLPGQRNIPLNTNEFYLIYPYIGKTGAHEKVEDGWPVLKFKIVNGQKILTYNINDDPLYNQRIHVITQRENDKPNLNVTSSSNPDKLKVIASDANLKDAVYSVDGGIEKTLTSGTEIDMGLLPGTHNIKVKAEDYFRLVTDTIFQRIITAPTNYAPTITFITPQNDAKYNNDVRLKGTITDAENDPITATYKLDNGAPIAIGKDFDNPLSLANGVHKIVITASDPTHTGKNAAKDSVLFEMNKLNYAPVIIITTPQNNAKYDKDVRLKGSITDAENDPITATYNLDGNSPITIGQIFDTPLSLADGLHKILIIASDPTHTGNNATKDSTIFEFKKATAVEPGQTLEDKTKYYPNPVENNLHIKYKTGMSGNAFMSITTPEGKQLLSKKINGAIEENFDMTAYKSGIYIFKVVDGIETQSIILIKQ